MAETIATPPATVVGAHAVSSLLSVQHAEKVFGAKRNLTHALDGVSLNIYQGEFVAIMGLLALVRPRCSTASPRSIA